MRCEEARPLISAGLDGELDGICAARLRTHLTECVSCSTEREMLTATVRLLRDLPETEPPAALRRRIGVALLEAERASQHRRSGLASLVWPNAPGWVWGATLGVTVAAVALLVPHRHGPSQHVVILPNTTHAAAQVLPVPTQPKSVVPHAAKLAVATPRKPVAIKPRLALPSLPDRLTAELPPSGARGAAPPVRLGFAALPAPSHRHPVRSHQTQTLLAMIRHASSGKAAPLATSHGALAPSNMPSDRSVRSADDSPRLAHTTPPSSTNPSTAPLPDEDSGGDTSGMTQMVSGGMPAGQETGDDDLTELRHRLIDRPLQVPELGQLKPATSHASRDGWIRF